MKLSAGILLVTLTAGLATVNSALAQNPNILQNVQDKMNGVQQQKKAASDEALSGTSTSGTASSANSKPAAATPAKPSASASAKPASAPAAAAQAVPVASAKAPAKPATGKPAAVATKASAATSTSPAPSSKSVAPAPAKVASAKAAPAKPEKPATPAKKDVKPAAAAVASAGNATAAPAKNDTAKKDDTKDETSEKKEDRYITAGNRRDPFISPVVQHMNGAGCSTGKRCLAIDQIALRGIVKSEAGMIAVVVNSLDKAYFLRENDPVFNGYVLKISGDSVVFKETVQDKLGHLSTRDVVKKITTPAV
jgi:hypothetical protein